MQDVLLTARNTCDCVTSSSSRGNDNHVVVVVVVAASELTTVAENAAKNESAINGFMAFSEHSHPSFNERN